MGKAFSDEEKQEIRKKLLETLEMGLIEAAVELQSDLEKEK